MKTGNFHGRAWYLRLVIFAAIGGIFYAGFWYFVTRSTRAETKEINAKIKELLPKNAQAQIAAQRLNEFRANYKARQEEYNELKALLPEQREITNVLQGLQDRARTSALTLKKFNPKEDVQQDFYSGKQIDVSVISSFASLRAFFEQMAHYQRIVSITNFEIKQLERQAFDKTVDARFDMTAYYASPERLQKQTPAKPGANGGQPQPATSAPAK